MSKICIEEALKDFKTLLDRIKFISENGFCDDQEPYHHGILIGIELCIKEIEKRLEGI